MFTFKRKFKSFFKYTIFILTFTVCCFTLFIEVFNLHINITNSIPVGIYKLDNLTPKVNDYALFCLNSDFEDLAKKRKYITVGKCNGLAPLGKKVAAVNQNTVKINEFGTFVDNHRLSKSTPLTADFKGRLMPKNHFEKTLTKDEYLMMSDEIFSFDSRYFGLVNKASIIGTIKPVLTIENGHIKVAT